MQSRDSYKRQESEFIKFLVPFTSLFMFVFAPHLYIVAAGFFHRPMKFASKNNKIIMKHRLINARTNLNYVKLSGIID